MSEFDRVFFDPNLLFKPEHVDEGIEELKKLRIVHYPERIRKIGWLLPRYEVLVPTRETPLRPGGSVWYYRYVVWGYWRAYRKAWG